MTKKTFAYVAAAAVLCSVTLVQPTQANAQSSQRFNHVHVVTGGNVPPKIQERVPELLGQVASLAVSHTAVDFAQGSLVIALGDNEVTRRYISQDEVSELGPEGFVVRSAYENGVTYLVGDGNAAPKERTSMKINRGVMFASYEILQRLGFKFLHPMAPTAPKFLSLKSEVEVSEKPRWEYRGLHLHTMHPLELTHVLNGWGPKGPDDAKGFEDLTQEWEMFCEWMIAHRQNKVEWVLLADKIHTKFNDSEARMNRLTKLVTMAHDWGLLTGIDVGIVFEQQNMWRLLPKPTKNTASNIAEIKKRIRWLMKADWDFVTFEMGQSEFTSPTDVEMLNWMNIVTAEMEDNYDRSAAVKVHVSTKQIAKSYKDPDTGEPLNFNFLPHFADKRLVVLPHTVQMYALDDPAPTYGNKDFQEIARFISMTAGERPVIFYPEAAYWVSYDVDMPLFLPNYAERRLKDLRLIAFEEDKGSLGRGALKGSKMQGQLLFSSGFEWSYWLVNLVAMRGAWNPHVEILNDLEAFEKVLAEIFGGHSPSESEVIRLLSDTADAQNQLLIRGEVKGQAPRKIDRLSGIAYLAGTETWDEINTTLNDVLKMPQAATQPHRLGFRSLRKKLNGQGVDYLNEVRPLLLEMYLRFTGFAQRAQILRNSVSNEDPLLEEIKEILDGSLINAHRATQVVQLYDLASAPNYKNAKAWAADRLKFARTAVDQAMEVTQRREKSFRVDADRIAGWGKNPTSYNYGYLWTARTLFFWWRDEGIVVNRPKNECYLNVVNPGDIAFGDGQDNRLYKLLKTLAKLPLVGSYKNCIAPSPNEVDPRKIVRGESSNAVRSPASSK